MNSPCPGSTPDDVEVRSGNALRAEQLRLYDANYNRTDGIVQIACAADGNAVRISVSDTGQGLSPE